MDLGCGLYAEWKNSTETKSLLTLGLGNSRFFTLQKGWTGLWDSRAAGTGQWGSSFHAPYTECDPSCWDSEGCLPPLRGVCLTDTGFLVSLQQEGAPEQASLLLTAMPPTPSSDHPQHFPQLGVEWALLIVTHHHYLGTRGESQV